MSKVGILGGTFDPPHVAHTAMASEARSRLALDKVLLMPAPSPPHKRAKRDGELSAYEHRLAMCEIAVGGVDGVEVSRFEERRAGPSYTADLVRAYRAETGDDVFFIMGSDSLADLSTWRDPERLLESCTLVVFRRPGVPIRLDVPGRAGVIVIEEPAIDVSSSDVRRRLERGQPVDELVDPAVLEYARRHSLYAGL